MQKIVIDKTYSLLLIATSAVIDGTTNGSDVLVARTIWPEDFRVDMAVTTQPPLGNEKMSDLIVAQNGGAAQNFQTRLLRGRDATERRNWAGMPVLGLGLSGRNRLGSRKLLLNYRLFFPKKKEAIP